MKDRRDSEGSLPPGHCSGEEGGPVFSGLRLGSWPGNALRNNQGNEKAPEPRPHQHLSLRLFPEAWAGKHKHIQQQPGLRLRRGWGLGKGILPFRNPKALLPGFGQCLTKSLHTSAQWIFPSLALRKQLMTQERGGKGAWKILRKYY